MNGLVWPPHSISVVRVTLRHAWSSTAHLLVNRRLLPRVLARLPGPPHLLRRLARVRSRPRSVFHRVALAARVLPVGGALPFWSISALAHGGAFRAFDACGCLALSPSRVSWSPRAWIAARCFSAACLLLARGGAMCGSFAFGFLMSSGLAWEGIWPWLIMGEARDF